MSHETNQLDVPSVWVSGNVIFEFAKSYEQQNIDRTLTEPLEPTIQAKMNALARVHGAFILGFDEGLELVRRSNEFFLDRERIHEISKPGMVLIDTFSTNRELVAPNARRLHKPVADYIDQFGWQASRVVFSAYRIIENTTIALVRFILGSEVSVAAVIGLASRIESFSSMSEFTHNALPVLKQNSQNLLTFFAHSPEFRLYLQWAFSLLEIDDKKETGN